MDQSASQNAAGGTSRRKFLKKTAATSLAAGAVTSLKVPVYGQNQAPSANVKGANDRIIIGNIGVGNQGYNAHVRQTQTHAKADNVVQVAVCDVYNERLDRAKKHIKEVSGNDVATFTDHRKLLERKDIDAVYIATVDHWHTPIAIDALAAGKHVYVEKPMTRYLGEAFALEKAVKNSGGKKLQVGSQITSGARWKKAGDLVRSGAIGPLVLGQGSYMRNAAAKGGEWNYNIEPEATPKSIDWKRWIEPIHRKVDFNADHFFRWRKYLPYCAGLLGDLFPHRLFPLMHATGNPEFPNRVVCVGTRKISLDRDVTDNTQVLAEFPSGLTLMITSSTVNEQGLPPMIRGHHATLNIASSGGKLDLTPERPFADEIDPESWNMPDSLNEVALHHKNWYDSIRTDIEPNCNIDLAVKVQTVISLAEMSERLNLCCLFDAKTRKITTGDGKVVEPITYGSLPLS